MEREALDEKAKLRADERERLRNLLTTEESFISNSSDEDFSDSDE